MKISDCKIGDIVYADWLDMPDSIDEIDDCDFDSKCIVVEVEEDDEIYKVPIRTTAHVCKRKDDSVYEGYEEKYLSVSTYWKDKENNSEVFATQLEAIRKMIQDEREYCAERLSICDAIEASLIP